MTTHSNHSTEPVDIADLLAYIDGVAPPTLAARIEASADLLRAATELGHERARLRAALFRHDCPDGMALGDYYLGYAGRSEAHTIESHVATCPHCARELVGLRDYLGEPERTPGLMERLRIFVGSLLDSGPQLQPAFAVRGATEGPLIFETGDSLQVIVDFQVDPARPGRRMLAGLVSGTLEQSLQIALWSAQSLLKTTATDEVGNFTLDDLLPGEYELVLSSESVVIHVPSLVVA